MEPDPDDNDDAANDGSQVFVHRTHHPELRDIRGRVVKPYDSRGRQNANYMRLLNGKIEAGENASKAIIVFVSSLVLRVSFKFVPLAFVVPMSDSEVGKSFVYLSELDSRVTSESPSHDVFNEICDRRTVRCC